MSKPFAVFDIDGTLVRWQLYHAIADALMRQGHIEPRAFEQVKIARMDWKRRSGDDSFKNYERALIDVFDAALKGLPEHAFEMACQTVFSEHKDQVYIYTRDLVKQLQADGYLLFAVSGSPSNIVSKLSDYYGLTDFAATTYPVENGYFVGTKDTTLNKKDELLKALVEKHGATFKGSIAIGDSESDISMLGLVERPIAFNPNKQLYKLASSKGWEIVIERKNVVYKLEPGDGHYHLS